MQFAQDMTTNKLNALLRGEIAAAETYDQALEVVLDPEVQNELQEVQCSHVERVNYLKTKVQQLGGQPAEDSGLWGAFAKAIEGSAKVMGEKAAINVLEEGEDKGLADYKKLLQEPDLQLQQVAKELFLKQEETHRRMSELKHRLH